VKRELLDQHRIPEDEYLKCLNGNKRREYILYRKIRWNLENDLQRKVDEKLMTLAGEGLLGGNAGNQLLLLRKHRKRDKSIARCSWRSCVGTSSQFFCGG
jgi:hypothetical protein